MSYAHYMSRQLEFEREPFTHFVEDMQRIINEAIAMGIRLAGPGGKGHPQLSLETVAFNGAANCGHRHRDLGKPFAAPDAAGVEDTEPPYDAKEMPWISGPYLKTRVCGGTCAAEPFMVDRKYFVRDWERPESPGVYAWTCETHFKPYDLIVTAGLVRLKHHLRKAVAISSENPAHGFEDAKRFLRPLFGFSDYFEIEVPRTEVLQ